MELDQDNKLVVVVAVEETGHLDNLLFQNTQNTEIL